MAAVLSGRGGGWRLFRLRGFDVRLEPSTLLLFAVVALPLLDGALLGSTGLGGSLLLMLMLVIGLFSSLLAHELSHALVGQAVGAEVESVSLHLLGGVTRFRRTPNASAPNVLIVLAGPFANLALALLATLGMGAGLVGRFFDDSSISNTPAWLTLPLTSVVVYNLLLGLFNLVPALPLDGGQALLYFVYGLTKRTRLASAVVLVTGVIVAVVLAIIALTLAVSFNLLGAGLFGVTAYAIIASSLTQYRHAQKLVANPQPLPPTFAKAATKTAYEYGLLCLAANRYAEALSAFDMALSGDSAHLTLRAARAYTNLDLRMPDAALPDLLFVTQMQPRNAAALRSLGYVFVMRGEDMQALTTYRRLCALEPRNALAHYNVACALAALRVADPAVPMVEIGAALSQAIGFDPALRERAKVNPLFQSLRADTAIVSVLGPVAPSVVLG